MVTQSDPRSKPPEKAKEKLDWRAALTRLEGAYADATLRAYRADLTAFETWCLERDIAPFPTSPETAAAFIADQARSLSASTIRRRLFAIRKIHRLLRLENPANDEEVTIALRRALRSKSARPHQALGLTQDLRSRLLASCPGTLAGKRDRALIAMGYDTLCRRSELVALRIEDLVELEDGSAQILIRRSKADPFGNGRLGFVSSETLKFVCDWVNAARIDRGYIFRRVRDGRIGKTALHPFSVNRILKSNAATAGMGPDKIRELSGHSMRVGAAQDMITSGLGILPIMRAGGWRTVNVVARYVENADLAMLMRSRQFPSGND